MAEKEMPEILIDYRLIRANQKISLDESGNATPEPVSIILDIFDARSKQLMWRSIVDTRLVVEVGEQERKKRADLVIEKMLADFPPK